MCTLTLESRDSPSSGKTDLCLVLAQLVWVEGEYVRSIHSELQVDVALALPPNFAGRPPPTATQAACASLTRLISCCLLELDAARPPRTFASTSICKLGQIVGPGPAASSPEKRPLADRQKGSWQLWGGQQASWELPRQVAGSCRQATRKLPAAAGRCRVAAGRFSEIRLLSDLTIGS